MFGVIRQNGIWGTLLLLIEQKAGIRIPLSHAIRWHASKRSEITFWDNYFRTKGLQWKEDYAERLNPRSEVSGDVADFLSKSQSLDVLDVGAGPLTAVGKYCGTRKLNLLAVDALADDYDRILRRYDVTPPVRTVKLSSESLESSLPGNSFDLTYARNCIDHSIDPIKSILGMIAVTKPGGRIYLIHSQNEAIKENWSGLHQWNLSEKDGDFVISSRTTITNFSKSYSNMGDIECKVDSDDFVIVSIRKRASTSP